MSFCGARSEMCTPTIVGIITRDRLIKTHALTRVLEPGVYFRPLKCIDVCVCCESIGRVAAHLKGRTLSLFLTAFVLLHNAWSTGKTPDPVSAAHS